MFHYCVIFKRKDYIEMACRYRSKEPIRKANILDGKLTMYDSVDVAHVIKLGTVLMDFPEDIGVIPNYDYVRCYLKRENIIFLLRYDGSWVIYKDGSKIIQQIGKLENKEDIENGELIALPIGVYNLDGYQYIASLDLMNPNNILLSAGKNTVSLGQIILRESLPLGQIYDYALAANMPVKNIFEENLIIILNGQQLFIDKKDFII